MCETYSCQAAARSLIASRRVYRNTFSELVNCCLLATEHIAIPSYAYKVPSPILLYLQPSLDFSPLFVSADRTQDVNTFRQPGRYSSPIQHFWRPLQRRCTRCTTRRYGFRPSVLPYGRFSCSRIMGQESPDLRSERAGKE